MAVNKSHLPEEPGEPVTALPRARKRNRLTHSFSERPGKHCENKRGNKCTKKFPAFNYPQALFLVAQGQENTHLFFPPGANPLGPSLGLSHSKAEDVDQDLPCGLPVPAAERGQSGLELLQDLWAPCGIVGAVLRGCEPPHHKGGPASRSRNPVILGPPLTLSIYTRPPPTTASCLDPPRRQR